MEFVKVNTEQQQFAEGNKKPSSRRRRRNASKTSLGDMLEDEPAFSGRTVEFSAVSTKSDATGVDKKRRKKGRGRGKDEATAGAAAGDGDDTAMDTEADEPDDAEDVGAREVSVLTTHLTSQEFESLNVSPKTKQAIKTSLKFKFVCLKFCVQLTYHHFIYFFSIFCCMILQCQVYDRCSGPIHS